jgi:hypothetical protein
MSTTLVDRFTAMIPELRAMDDVAGGGTVLSLAQQQLGVVADLLDQASYDESGAAPPGRAPDPPAALPQAPTHSHRPAHPPLPWRPRRPHSGCRARAMP